MLADINTDPYYLNGLAVGSMGSQPCYLTVFKNRAYFSANASVTDVSTRLWSTDGTQAGTTQFTDLRNPAGFLVYKNELYFRANDLTTAVGNQMWRSDGTSAGTRPLVPATGAADAFSGMPWGISNDKLILLVPTSSPPVTYSLWATDSTASGTVRLEHTTLHGLLVLRDRLYFTNDAGGDEEPWVSDGTPGGTHRLADLDSAGSSHPMSYVNFNGVTMIATADATGPHLWHTDGTEAGTVQVAKLPLDPLFPFFSYTVSGQNLFFLGYDDFSYGELYVLSNDAPVAVADSANAANGQAVTINVLANDADADGSLDASSTRVVQGPAHGKAAVGANGSVTYTPTPGYSGTDTFTYTVADNQGSTSGAATVTVAVTGAPPPPADGGSSVTGSGSQGGGGGALSWYELVALAALTLFRIPGLKKART
jgi:ELWxxDGT repeat protein